MTQYAMLPGHDVFFGTIFSCSLHIEASHLKATKSEVWFRHKEAEQP